MRLPAYVSAILLGTLFLAGCADSGASGGPGDQTQAAPQSGQFTGVALPSGYSLDTNRSLALGAGDRWIGRISFTSGLSPDDMLDFFRREMPKYGWTEGTVVRGESSMITFTSSPTARVAVIQITDRTFGGSRVDMVVSPQTDSSGTGGGAMPSAQPGAVSTQPLR